MRVLDVVVHTVPVPGRGAVENQINQRESVFENGELIPE